MTTLEASLPSNLDKSSADHRLGTVDMQNLILIECDFGQLGVSKPQISQTEEKVGGPGNGDLILIVKGNWLLFSPINKAEPLNRRWRVFLDAS
ncbi:hypothetical protein AVEN_15981-1 [Araneus ventricosus]|uniref:Uncharacterized protein n=1 Tax=Araneus ventricosus TaxID=182803 RepID=A0A4Y2UC58_ARAVE|nr:hypothetical protein AVEN_15981-1 [Araneus ventricosus]